MTTTIMPRTMRCTNCNYIQKDYVSYYKHRKTWDSNHDLQKCNEIRKSKNAFDKMFRESLDSLASLSIIK